jgi:hypothetical protein
MQALPGSVHLLDCYLGWEGLCIRVWGDGHNLLLSWLVLSVFSPSMVTTFHPVIFGIDLGWALCSLHTLASAAGYWNPF